MLKRPKDWAMFGAATLAVAHSSGNGALSQEAVSGAILVRSLAVVQAVCLMRRGRAVVRLTSASTWRRSAKSMLGSDGSFCWVLSYMDRLGWYGLRKVPIYAAKEDGSVL
jgi:hypothetical protein